MITILNLRMRHSKAAYVHVLVIVLLLLCFDKLAIGIRTSVLFIECVSVVQCPFRDTRA